MSHTISLIFRQPETGHTLYFEPTWHDTRTPPALFVVVTHSPSWDRHQIGPMELTGATQDERRAECLKLLTEIIRDVYKLKKEDRIR